MTIKQHISNTVARTGLASPTGAWCGLSAMQGNAMHTNGMFAVGESGRTYVRRLSDLLVDAVDAVDTEQTALRRRYGCISSCKRQPMA